jgi:hypothetical protein
VKPNRTLLTGFLLVAAFLLSFGALRHRALHAGIIHGDLGLPFGIPGRLSAHTIAGVWALTLDGLTAVGVLGVRDKTQRDWRAWVALALGLGLSLWFQTSGYPTWTARGMAAVPPLALAMAVWIFEVPKARWVPDWATEPVVPLSDPPADPVDEPTEPDPAEQPARTNSRTRWQPADDPRVLERLAEGKTPNAIRTELKLTDRQYRYLLDYNRGEQALSVGHSNGDRS